MSKAMKYLPTWHDAVVATGATVGGALGGGLGMIPGAAAGEAAWQIGQTLTKSPEAPQSMAEAAKRQVVQGAIAGAVPIAGKTGSLARQGYQSLRQIGGRAAGKLAPRWFRSPETLMSRALPPGKTGAMDFEKYTPAALTELKQAEKTIGPMTSANKVRQGLEIRSRANNDAFNRIVDPQRNVTIPNSGSAMRQAEIASIPDAIRLGDPATYARTVQTINRNPVQDLTLGELNDIRVSGNKMLAGKFTMITIDLPILFSQSLPVPFHIKRDLIAP